MTNSPHTAALALAPHTAPNTAPDTALLAVVFDWAGTLVDFGSLAPMGAFVDLFARHDIQISIAQARIPMGLPKRAHIVALGALPEIDQQWQALYRRALSANDADELLAEFEPMSAASALQNSQLIDGVLETMAYLQARGMGVATTTGYTRRIMLPVIEAAAAQGFAPSLVVCCDDVARSRPDPMGMALCMKHLGLSPDTDAARVVKVDDTVPGIEEGLNAGCWTVGVAASGNALGWTAKAWDSASADEREVALRSATAQLLAGGAHEVIATVADLPAALARIEQRMANGERPA